MDKKNLDGRTCVAIVELKLLQGMVSPGSQGIILLEQDIRSVEGSRHTFIVRWPGLQDLGWGDWVDMFPEEIEVISQEEKVAA